MLKRNSSRALRIDDGDGIPIIIGAISYAQTPYLSATLDDQKTRGKERERIVPDTLPSRDTSRDAGTALIVRYCTLRAGKARQKCTREKKDTDIFTEQFKRVIARSVTSKREPTRYDAKSIQVKTLEQYCGNIEAILQFCCNIGVILEQYCYNVAPMFHVIREV